MTVEFLDTVRLWDAVTLASADRPLPDEIVTLRDGRPAVADPFFGAWLHPAAGHEPVD